MVFPVLGRRRVRRERGRTLRDPREAIELAPVGCLPCPLTAPKVCVCEGAARPSCRPALRVSLKKPMVFSAVGLYILVLAPGGFASYTTFCHREVSLWSMRLSNFGVRRGVLG